LTPAQNFFTYFYGAAFNLIGLAALYTLDGGAGPTLLQVTPVETPH
jgi:hypothetical protein